METMRTNSLHFETWKFLQVDKKQIYKTKKKDFDAPIVVDVLLPQGAMMTHSVDYSIDPCTYSSIKKAEHRTR